MSPELFTTYTERHSKLTEELLTIEESFEEVAREIAARVKKMRSKFHETVDRYASPSFETYDKYDSIKIDTICEEAVCVIYTIDGYDGDADENITADFDIKLFRDYYFDRAAFDQYFEDEYTCVVEKYNSDKLKRDELVKNSEHDLFLTLKKKYEGPLT